jgi:hypothetical protein
MSIIHINQARMKNVNCRSQLCFVIHIKKINLCTMFNKM